jgi:zinc transport system ATP-binding protein
MTLLKATHIFKHYHGKPVVKDVSLTLRAGERVTIIGPNGGGKTTLLKLLLGLASPDKGEIIRKSGLSIGYVPQRVAINTAMPMTAQWFLKLYADGENIMPMAELTGITHTLSRSVHTLSGGEWQRVLLARALLRKPELLVLDEPMQGIDIAGQAQMYALINHAAKTLNAAVLMVSHDLHVVMSGTDHVVCLNHHICCEGHPHAVKEDAAYRDLFTPDVANNLAIYTHHHDHEHTHDE